MLVLYQRETVYNTFTLYTFCVLIITCTMYKCFPYLFVPLALIVENIYVSTIRVERCIKRNNMLAWFAIMNNLRHFQVPTLTVMRDSPVGNGFDHQSLLARSTLTQIHYDMTRTEHAEPAQRPNIDIYISIQLFRPILL